MMYRKITLLLMVFLNIVSLAGQSFEFGNKKLQLDSLFGYCYQNGLFNGYVLITQKEKVLFKRSFGTISPNLEQKITGDTPFLMASLSKQFTAMAIVYLHSKGKLDYNDKVRDYLPNFNYDNITIRQLLQHSSGLKEYTSFLNSTITEHTKAFEEQGIFFTNNSLAELFTKRRPSLDFEPGTNFEYSNTGYAFLALIIESISKMSFVEFMEKRFFTPLEMHNTYVKKAGVEPILSYKENPVTTEKKIIEMPHFLEVYGDGGIYSSAADLIKWFNAIDEGKVVGTEYLDEAYTPARIGGKEVPYGFGWFVRQHPTNQHRIITHSGQFLGFTNSVLRDLDNGVNFIVLSNNHHNIKGSLNSAVLGILYDQPYDYPKANTEKWFIQKLLNEGIAKVKEEYALEENQSRYDWSEKMINSIGYELLFAGKLEEARSVFSWNTNLYPGSSNVYDSLGEVCLALGNDNEAIRNYQKALEIDEKNVNAKMMLEKIKQKYK